MIRNKLKKKIDKLSKDDKVLYYTRFDYSPFLSARFSINYYILFLTMSILIIVTAIHHQLDGDTVESIKIFEKVSDMLRIIIVFMIADMVTYVCGIIVYYYKRHRFFKVRNL